MSKTIGDLIIIAVYYFVSLICGQSNVQTIRNHSVAECLSVFTGAKVAQYAGKHLHKYIVKRSEYKEGRIEDALRQVRVV